MSNMLFIVIPKAKPAIKFIVYFSISVNVKTYCWYFLSIYYLAGNL